MTDRGDRQGEARHGIAFKDTFKRRVDEAARVIDHDRLGLCPQCGFAILYRYDSMAIDLQERKLEPLVATICDIWG